MAAPTEPDARLERAALAERLLSHLEGSIQTFQRDALASLHTEFWSYYVREPGATMATLDAVLANQVQLVTDLCDQMSTAVVAQCMPLAAMVTENVATWAQALQVEATRVREEPTMEPATLHRPVESEASDTPHQRHEHGLVQRIAQLEARLDAMEQRSQGRQAEQGMGL